MFTYISKNLPSYEPILSKYIPRYLLSFNINLSLAKLITQTEYWYNTTPPRIIFFLL